MIYILICLYFKYNDTYKKKNRNYYTYNLNNINSALREFKALLYLELSNFKDILNPINLTLKYNDNNNSDCYINNKIYNLIKHK